jgi:hypothetical protein
VEVVGVRVKVWYGINGEKVEVERQRRWKEAGGKGGRKYQARQSFYSVGTAFL